MEANLPNLFKHSIINDMKSKTWKNFVAFPTHSSSEVINVHYLSRSDFGKIYGRFKYLIKLPCSYVLTIHCFMAINCWQRIISAWQLHTSYSSGKDLQTVSSKELKFTSDLMKKNLPRETCYFKKWQGNMWEQKQ